MTTLSLEQFLQVARSRFDVAAPMYVRIHGQLVEITGVTVEIDVAVDGLQETRRTVLHTQLEAPFSLTPMPDPMDAFKQFLDRIAPKREPWEEPPSGDGGDPL